MIPVPGRHHRHSTPLPDSTIVLLANVAKDVFAPKIKDADEDLFGEVATRDLVASTTYGSTSYQTTFSGSSG